VAPTQIQDPDEWNRLLLTLPGPHLLQSWQWGELKAGVGWIPERWMWSGAGGKAAAAAQVLRRPLRLLPQIAVLYAPRGPCLDYADEPLRHKVMADLEEIARRRGGIFLKVDPSVLLGTGISGSPTAEDPVGASTARDLEARGWRPSREQIQFRNTMTIDLTHGEESLLGGMKQKTRYNIRLAERRGVCVRPGTLDDLGLLYRMYAETSLRDGFVIRHEAYYRQAWGSFVQSGMAQILVAEVQGEPVAAIVVYQFGGTCWYLYGMSRQAHREDMPNHLLQWEAMRWARARGCHTYDFWGAPDRLAPDDPMWGVYRFKEGFGAQLLRTIGAWDFPVRPALYAVYTRVLPRLLALMRARGRAQTSRSLDG
jgi:lipid II:glycine glycyltransferase (peptidoglycan interpeptide bridge formation enzyme)